MMVYVGIEVIMALCRVTTKDVNDKQARFYSRDWPVFVPLNTTVHTVGELPVDCGRGWTVEGGKWGCWSIGCWGLLYCRYRYDTTGTFPLQRRLKPSQALKNLGGVLVCIIVLPTWCRYSPCPMDSRKKNFPTLTYVTFQRCHATRSLARLNQDGQTRR